jgi:hypothetical protein
MNIVVGSFLGYISHDSNQNSLSMPHSVLKMDHWLAISTTGIVVWISLVMPFVHSQDVIHLM